MSNKNGANGIAGLIFGITAGIAAVAAGGLAAVKVLEEIKNDSQETTIVSPDEKNFVTIKCGSSKFAKGLTHVKVSAENDNDNCALSFLAGKNSNKITFNWKDNDHFEFCLGDGKVKQYCNVSFDGEQIKMVYFLKKISV